MSNKIFAQKQILPMSKNKESKKKKKKIVRVPENELISLMENIVKDAVKAEKKKWIAEQEAKKEDRIKMLESRIADLNETVNSMMEIDNVIEEASKANKKKSEKESKK